MPIEKSREDLYKQIVIYGSTFLISLFLIAAGYVIEHLWERPLLSHMSTEIGIAGIVAIILALTIEYQSKKSEERRAEAERESERTRVAEERLRQADKLLAEREAIKKDVFEHVLGYRLPKGLVAEIHTQILNAWFIRTDFTASYVLTPIEIGTNKTKFMKLEGTLSYKIVNRMPETKPYTFTTVIEKAPVEEANPLVRFTSVNVKGCEEPLILDTEEKISEAVDHVKRPNHLLIEKQISILGNTHASAIIRFDAVRVFDGGTSFLLHPLQTVGFELKVQAPEDVDVLASAYLPEQLSEGDFHLKNANRYHWTLNRPILPYQGVYLTWKAKVAA